MFSRDDKTATTPAVPGKPAAVQPAPATAPVTEAPRSEAPRQAAPAPRPAGPEQVSLISASLKITGQLESDEDIQIDGQVEGDIRARKVSIGPKASVKGTVFGEDVDLAGTVNGKIEAKTVVLAKTARMTGDVVHDVLQVDKGAYLDGHCRPHSSPSAASEKKASGS